MTAAIPTESKLLRRIDEFCELVGDKLNPILVKETRQALKSRQFVITFSILLFAALAWTIIGSLMMMPRIYTSPSAPRMLIGYYIVLAIPMLMVVPLAAYRSLEGEIDDGTLELLSITVLSPWQIVIGKLASAVLQMLLYFVALFPCVAYAYTLRGVDLPTVLLMVAVLLVAGLLLTVVALFFAPLARTRSGRIVTLLAVMMILLGAEWGLAVLVINMIMYGNPLSSSELYYVVLASIAIPLSLGHLLLATTAAQLTPDSENRSTQIRCSMLIVTSVALGLSALAILMLGRSGFSVAVFMCLTLSALWTVAASMMCAESPIVTPRVRRELPSSFLSRAALTWLTPGPATGLVFSSTAIVVTTAFIVGGMMVLRDQGNGVGMGRELNVFPRICIAYSTYLIGFLTAVYWVIAQIRRRNHPRVELGIAALIAVAVLSALIPYSIGLHFNDYRDYPYSMFQITNWAWTISEVARTSTRMALMVPVGFFVTLSFMVTVLSNPKLVFPRRIAMPKRVQQELDANKASR
ncbi:ABC-2 family transporter protein [Rubripirellula amarantea]|uniref:ABC-2 family transporter protein n=1 Tax=Rubripirellula amarantea TaxID=2527999 RepID=A0A5C5WIX2_9BACT|nr:ABC transporter permease [Rubripirellula amarantea]TWT50698.1 ABC-2 family transporter protein [Rubripirellula amarantea]